MLSPQLHGKLPPHFDPHIGYAPAGFAYVDSGAYVTQTRPLPPCLNILRIVVLALCSASAALFIFDLVYSATSATPYNEKLIEELRQFALSGLTFTHIYRFQKHLYYTSEFGWKSGITPNYGGVVHHEGLVLELADAAGVPTKFLRLEMQPKGLTYFINPTFPVIHDFIPWSEREQAIGGVVDNYPFKRGRIGQTMGQPGQLIVLLEKMRYWRYDPMRFNCFSFSQQVWDYFKPFPTTHDPQNMQQIAAN